MVLVNRTLNIRQRRAIPERQEINEVKPMNALTNALRKYVGHNIRWGNPGRA